MLSQRLLSSVILIPTFIWLILESHTLWGILLLLCFMCFFCISGLFELSEMLKNKKLPSKTKALSIFSLSYLVLLTASLKLNIPHFTIDSLIFFLLLFFLLISQFGTMKKKQPAQSVILPISTQLFSFTYITWTMGFLLKILFIQGGPYWIFYLLLVAKGSDIFAYFVGKSLGKNKLIPHISPGKTIEGSIGGLIGALILSTLAWKFLLPEINFYLITATSFLISIIAQLADLSESLLKRDANIKDSGTILPGLGGILDLFDSLLLTAPILFIISQTLFPKFFRL